MSAALIDRVSVGAQDVYITGQSFGTGNEIIHEATGRTDLNISYIKEDEGLRDYIKVAAELVYGDKPAEIALCTLAAVNLGKIRD